MGKGKSVKFYATAITTAARHSGLYAIVRLPQLCSAASLPCRHNNGIAAELQLD